VLAHRNYATDFFSKIKFKYTIILKLRNFSYEANVYVKDGFLNFFSYFDPEKVESAFYMEKTVFAFSLVAQNA